MRQVRELLSKRDYPTTSFSVPKLAKAFGVIVTAGSPNPHEKTTGWHATILWARSWGNRCCPPAHSGREHGAVRTDARAEI